jgi:hypothetical protein
MPTTMGSAHYAGLLPVDLRDEPLPIRPTTLENDRRPNAQPSLRKRNSHTLSRFLIAFCSGVATTLAWWLYGDAARQMITNSYPQAGWLAPPQVSTAQEAPGTMAAPAVSVLNHLDAMLGDLHAMRQSLDRIVAGQELIMRNIDEIATSIAAGQEQSRRSTDLTAPTITTGQGQVTRNTDPTTTSLDQAPSSNASMTVESRGDAASLQPTAPLNVKPTEARPPQTLSETGKQLSAASAGHDASCFPSASALLRNHPGGWPTWTLRAPGHVGTLCWYAASRPRGGDHRPRLSDAGGEKTPEKEIVGTTENGPSAPPASYTRPPE